METFGITTVRNEEDVIEGVIRHMAIEVDYVIVADNMSTDRTQAILCDLMAEQLPLTVFTDPDPAHNQSEKMSALAALAHKNGADWIVPFDADELWHAPLMLIKDYLKHLRSNVVTAELRNHYRTPEDLDSRDPFESMVYADPEPLRLPKVAFRYSQGAVIQDGNHGVILKQPIIATPGLQVRHFPYRSVKQFISKVEQGYAALKLTDRNELTGAHWRAYGKILEEEGPGGLETFFYSNFFFDPQTSPHMKKAPAPYQRRPEWKIP